MFDRKMSARRSLKRVGSFAQRHRYNSRDYAADHDGGVPQTEFHGVK